MGSSAKAFSMQKIHKSDDDVQHLLILIKTKIVTITNTT